MKWAAALLALCATSAASAPPPPPPPPPSSMNVVVDGHNVSGLFRSYRQHINARVQQEFEEHGKAVVDAAIAELGSSATIGRRLDMEILSMNGRLLFSSAAELCSGTGVPTCRWHLLQYRRSSNAILPEQFDVQRAVAALVAAGVSPSETYAADVVDVIGGYEDLAAAATRLDSVSAAQCSAVTSIEDLWASLDTARAQQVARAYTGIPPPPGHGPHLFLTFTGDGDVANFLSGFRQVDLISQSESVFDSIARACAIPAWPNY